jgi:hypothetical protein
MMMMMCCDLLLFDVYVLQMLLTSFPECAGHMTGYGC